MFKQNKKNVTKSSLLGEFYQRHRTKLLVGGSVITIAGLVALLYSQHKTTKQQKEQQTENGARYGMRWLDFHTYPGYSKYRDLVGIGSYSPRVSTIADQNCETYRQIQCTQFVQDGSSCVGSSQVYCHYLFGLHRVHYVQGAGECNQHAIVFECWLRLVFCFLISIPESSNTTTRANIFCGTSILPDF